MRQQQVADGVMVLIEQGRYDEALETCLVALAAARQDATLCTTWQAG